MLEQAEIGLNRMSHSPIGKVHRIRGAPPKTFPNVMYEAPEEVGGSPI